MTPAAQAQSGSDIWTDFKQGYVPPETLNIDPALELDEAYDEDVDPVTYEVLRHRLWTLNEEHGRTLENVSGSPVAYFGQDFNTTIHAADGETVLGAAYVQFFSAIAELIVKWILENRSSNPGIQDGDIFLNNDPWVGSTHQPDVFFLAPVFHEGKLFCWVSNALHQYDIGGVDPGGFCPSADDVFSEPTPIPPIKVVEQGTVRQDLRQMYMRHSRLPQMIGLDFNAQVAGIQVTRRKIKNLIDKYGPRVVKGVMEKIVQDSETTFLERIREIPDGTWRSRAYMDGSKIGDNKLYKFEIQLMKQGERLVFRNDGTAANTGASNITYAGFRTGISCALNPMMLYDQLWVSSGAYRHIDIETEPGTMNRAEHPAAVSCGGNMSIEITLPMIFDVVSRMLSASDTSREDIIVDPLEGLIVISQAGIDQWGNPYGTMNLDVMGTGMGARTDRDGMDVSGIIWSPKGPLPNIENNEQDYPMLYLYRREAEDSGGAGEYRGGAGMEACWVPHKTEGVETGIVATGAVTPHSKGIGAYPGTPVRSRSVVDSDVLERFDEGRIPADLETIDGDRQIHPPKTQLYQDPDHVLETRSPGAGGYGDPLNRPPRKVLLDVRKGRVSLQAARSIYGVVFQDSTDALEVDEQATEEQRKHLVQRRLENSVIPAGND